jgi:dipeptidyl aminopeptidase/acylaminoacyl peptidase
MSIPPKIPIETFFRNPAVTQYSISPDGTKYAFLSTKNSRLNIVLYDKQLKTEQFITDVSERDISYYIWVSSEVIVYFYDTGGDENFKAFACSVLTGVITPLTPFDGVVTSLVSRLYNDPKHILISMNKENPQVFDVYKCNVETGELTLIAKNPGNVMAWMCTDDGTIKCVYVQLNPETEAIGLWNQQDNSFSTLIEIPFPHSADVSGISADGSTLYLSTNLFSNCSQLFEYSIDKNSFTKLYEHPSRDAFSLVTSDRTKKPIFSIINDNRRTIHYFNDTLEQLHRNVAKEIGRSFEEVVMIDLDFAEENFIFVVTTDRLRGEYYSYDSKANNLALLGCSTPWLEEEQLATMKEISYTTRDGKTMFAFLTVPNGVTAENLPLVLNPHGGPWVQDRWGYNPEVQFLANRGFAVVQPNYRGSLGFGLSHYTSAFKQWGKKMQDDLTDCVQHLINEGIADSKRIAIYGASYGGFATLAGITFTPELYACAIDYVGVSNLFTFFESFPEYWKPFLGKMYKMIGHPEEDKELLFSSSPVNFVDRIITPLFVAQGANDPRVKKAESDQIVDALQKRGISIEYMVKDNEGHGFQNEENKMEFYYAMERFLLQHIPLSYRN